ncbi:unnamed protein product [Symbiodinium natans]|uniref:Uncharacterized protein n=1 Tax=Symbiodinium natans TaxID=878477 RepID=A0A812MPN2_9DINO|nr:unnamed protein product [Symbiodinium natans]
MEGHVGQLVLCRCSQAEQLAVRTSSRGSLATAVSAMEELRLAPSCLSEPTHKLCHLLQQLPLRRLSLRGMERLSVKALAELLRAAPRCQECDVRFALPLHWPTFGPWLEGLRASPNGRLQVVHSLHAEPSPSLTAYEVMTAQAYSLHCGRIEGCFRFASPGNQMVTGPIARFARMFDPPSRYSIMVGCERFEIEDEHVSTDPRVKTFRVTFWQGDKSPLTSPHSQQSFMWQLSMQPQSAPSEFVDCWMTDAVVPLDLECIWDGSLLDD